MLAVKTLTHFTKICIAPIIGLCKQTAFSFKICPHGIKTYLPLLYSPIKIYNVRIRVADKMSAAQRRIEADNTCTKERFNPTCIQLDSRSQNEFIYPGNKFCFDSL